MVPQTLVIWLLSQLSLDEYYHSLFLLVKPPFSKRLSRWPGADTTNFRSGSDRGRCEGPEDKVQLAPWIHWRSPYWSLYRDSRISHDLSWYGGLEHAFFIFHFIYGMSSFPLTNSYFSEGLKPPTSYCRIILLQISDLVGWVLPVLGYH